MTDQPGSQQPSGGEPSYGWFGPGGEFHRTYGPGAGSWEQAQQPSASPAGQPTYPPAGRPPTYPPAGQPYGYQPPPPPPQAPQSSTKSRRGPAIVAAAAVVGAVVGAGVGTGTYAALNNGNNGTTAALPISNQQAPLNAPAKSVAGVAAALKPSVVTIDAVGTQEAGTGSGVIVRSNGYILTNDHVVSLAGSQSPNSVKLTVVFDNGQQATARVVGADPTDDLAVVKVNKTGLTAATFADSNKLAVGQPVVAIGAPLGLSATVTSGIVSALDRPVQAGDNGQAVFDAVQTDAAINPGNSGGPLVDLAGHVVGINSAIASTSQSQSPFSSGQSGNIGIGFAIPSDEATRVAGQLIATGKATHAEMGIFVSSTPGQNSLAPTSGAGAKVARVKPNSPASAAGIKAGDVITAVGDQRIDDPVSLVAAVRSHAPGQTVSVQLNRGGKPATVSVKLAGQS